LKKNNLEIILLGEDSLVNSMWVECIGLFYKTKFIEIDNLTKIEDLVSDQKVCVVALIDSNEVRGITHSLYIKLCEQSQHRKNINWINLPVRGGFDDMPNKGIFPPNLLNTLQCLESEKFKLIPLSTETALISNRDILIDKISILRHELLNKIAPFDAFCKRRLKSFESNEDFSELKKKVGEFLGMEDTSENYIEDVLKSLRNFIGFCNHSGVILEDHFPKFDQQINDSIQFVSRFWAELKRPEQLKEFSDELKKTSSSLASLRDQIKNSSK
jgi:hypothetical protein